MTVNKFDLAWQVVRVEAKGLNHPANKIKRVMEFLGTNFCEDNVVRVTNWLEMSRQGYKDNSAKQYYTDALESVYRMTCSRKYDTVIPKQFSDYHVSVLQRVYRDLLARKNDFHHGGNAPKDQIKFMGDLLEYINTVPFSDVPRAISAATTSLTAFNDAATALSKHINE